MKNVIESTLILLVKNNTKVLMQLRDNKPNVGGANTWGFPGGKLEKNEKIWECAKRELKEETGYIAKNLTYLTEFTAVYKKDTTYHTKAFLENYDNKQEINCFEGQKMVFVDIEKGKKLVNTSPMSSHFVYVLTKLQNYLKEVKEIGN